MAWNSTLTLDIEGGVVGVERFSGGRVFRNALEVSCVQPPIHGAEFEVAALLEAPLAVLQGLAVVKPAVSDVGRIADLAAQHGAAAVQGILGFGLLGELNGSGLDGQNWKGGEKGERGESQIRMGLLLTFYCFFRSLSVRHSNHLALWRNVMFRQ